MTTLIVYQSVEGQTAKIAKFVQSMLHRLGTDVILVDTSDAMVDVSYDNVDRVILAAPVHERRHPRFFELFLTTERENLRKFPTLMLSVSLKAAFDNVKEEAQEFLIEMEMRTGFVATNSMLIAGAVRRDNYSYFASQILKYVVLDGQDPNLAAEDREFTDWAALEAAVLDFLSIDQK